MSRVGKLPVVLPSGVQAELHETCVRIHGPKGTLEQALVPQVRIVQGTGVLTVERKDDAKTSRAMHGLYRALLQNMVTGVSQGFTAQLELVGVGYKAAMYSKDTLELNLGYSHSIFFQLPKEVVATAEMVKGKNPTVTLQSLDKQLLGQVAAKLRSLRKPEPYKGKGVKFVGEVLRRKAGKTTSK